ncbi:hypothetical protein ACHAWU_002529 [Discostella pseudostelligera]|uniref:F-actin-capping protein subunit alpha n=1 Tax=Discostella pseudostelligera TaxID=259834 RepID=A0ABD3M1L3_9STRA
MTEMNQTAINSILLASPPGQFDIILDDLRSLLPKSSVSTLLESRVVNDVRAEWEASTGRSTLAAAADCDGGVGKSESDDANQCYISSLSNAMDTYLASNFSSSGVRAARTVTIASTADTDDAPKRTLTINTYAEKIDLHNYQAVSWKGCYTISLPLASTSNILQGQIDIWAHTFENGGNFHLRSNISLNAKIKQRIGAASDDNEQQSAWASSITHQIKSWDKVEVMQHITEMFDSIRHTYMKRLRRVMPMTRTKMDWNVAGHRVVQTLCEGHDKR